MKYWLTIFYLFDFVEGIDQFTIATLFKIKNQHDISRILSQVREELNKNFVPCHLGPQTLTRIEWLNHNSHISKSLFDASNEQLILVADGTYCYCQKSSNNAFQRKTWSTHKGRHLVKPFVICTSDGHILDIYGLFEATTNDASILSTILSEDKSLSALLKENDIFLLDRGFRDCLKEFEEKYKLFTKMPSLMARDEKQLDSKSANQTRFVTKCRWVVEVVNSFLRTFKALKQVPNKSLPHVFQDFKIAGALINKFFKRLISDEEDSDTIIQSMKKKNRNNK